MLVTERTRAVLDHGRTTKKWIAEGFEEVGEQGGKLWELYRGIRVGKRIVEARVPPGGLSVFVRVE